MSLIRQGIDKFYEQDEEPSVFRRRGDPGFVMSDPPETTTPEPKPRIVPQPGETTAQAIRRARQELISPEVTPQVKPGERIRLGRQEISPSDPLYQRIVQQTSVPTTPVPISTADFTPAGQTAQDISMKPRPTAPGASATPSATVQDSPVRTAPPPSSTGPKAAAKQIYVPEIGYVDPDSLGTPRGPTLPPPGFTKSQDVVDNKTKRVYHTYTNPEGEILYRRVGKPYAPLTLTMKPTAGETTVDVAKKLGRAGKYGALVGGAGYLGNLVYNWNKLDPAEQQKYGDNVSNYLAKQFMSGYSDKDKPSSTAPVPGPTPAPATPKPSQPAPDKSTKSSTPPPEIKWPSRLYTPENKTQIDLLLKEFKYFIEAKSKD